MINYLRRPVLVRLILTGYPKLLALEQTEHSLVNDFTNLCLLLAAVHTFLDIFFPKQEVKSKDPKVS